MSAAPASRLAPAARCCPPTGANQSVLGTATDLAGNSDTTTADGIEIDATKPTNIAFTGVLNYVFGDAQTTPTCTADWTTPPCWTAVWSAGPAPRSVRRRGRRPRQTTPGNTDTLTATYQVAPWTMTGFYSPVDMNGVWNAAKGGSTIPLKFEMFKGSVELTDASASGPDGGEDRV